MPIDLNAQIRERIAPRLSPRTPAEWAVLAVLHECKEIRESSGDSTEADRIENAIARALHIDS